MTNPRKITKAIIPAAGKGTRLLPLTKAVPKELLPLGKKTVLDHIVEEAIRCGITEALLVISQEKTAIRAHFGESIDGVRLQYTFQAEQKGLADAIYCGREFAGDEPFAVVLGDSTIETDQAVLPFRRVLDTYEKTNAKGVIVVQKTPREEVGRYGIVKPKAEPRQPCFRQLARNCEERQIDENTGYGMSFEIDGLVEKPSPSDAPSEYAVAGRYAFDPVIFDYIERTPRGANGEYQISDSIDLMLRDSNEVWCVALGEHEIRRDIGTFESYFEAFQIEIGSG